MNSRSLSAVLTLTFLFLRWAPVATAQKADTVLLNATIYTVDEDNRVVEAVAVNEGRIVAVGNESDMLALAGPGARVLDLKSKFAYPGFIDAHGHMMGLGRSLQELNFVGTDSYEEIVDRVYAKAESLPDGAWVFGRGWDQNDWPEKSFPHHGALSEAAPNNPVSLTRIDGHALLVNAEAMRIAGITRDTPDPPGGRIIRDDQGNPTGVLIDRAQGIVSAHIPESTTDLIIEALELAAIECLEAGLTSVHDAGVSGRIIDLYRRMIDERNFQLRIYAMITAGDREALDHYFESGPVIGYGSGRLTVRSVKAVADGALGSRGAALHAPYIDDPDHTGSLILSQEEIQSLTQRALEAGFQMCTHAIGDKANHIVLDAYAEALRAVPSARDPRLRIEHAQIVALDDIPRFAELGVIPSMQATHATSDMYWAEDRVGPERIKGGYAWQMFLKEGSRIANGSDFPVEGVNPLWGFYASITRQDHAGWPEGGWMPEQRMTREQALRSFTIDAAYAAFEENEKGSLEPGKFADLVVLSRDIMTVKPAEILATHVMMTILDGQVVYEKLPEH